MYLIKFNLSFLNCVQLIIFTFCFRYLAKGIDLNTISEDFLIGRSTAYDIVKHTCIQIWNVLQPNEMPEPIESIWNSNSELFYKKTNFPNCVGAIDGKHVRIKSPSHSGSNYYNYKKYFSIVLMAVADANCCFTTINVGDYGKESDNSIFRKSTLGQKFFRNDLNLPEDKNLPSYTNEPQPFVFVGDEAFGLHRNMMRPYPNRNLDRNKRIFNYRLSRARRCVECAFGILTNKWRVFHSSMQVNPDFAIDIVKATCVLHNFVRRRVGANFDDEFLKCPLQCIQQISNGRRLSSSAIATRDFFKNYFVSEVGALPWQNRINSVF